MDWWPIHSVSRLSPTGDRYHPPGNPTRHKSIRKWMDGWMKHWSEQQEKGGVSGIKLWCHSDVNLTPRTKTFSFSSLVEEGHSLLRSFVSKIHLTVLYWFAKWINLDSGLLRILHKKTYKYKFPKDCHQQPTLTSTSEREKRRSLSSSYQQLSRRFWSQLSSSPAFKRK